MKRLSVLLLCAVLLLCGISKYPFVHSITVCYSTPGGVLFLCQKPQFVPIKRCLLRFFAPDFRKELWLCVCVTFIG